MRTIGELAMTSLSAAAIYDKSLRRARIAHLPENAPRPQPSTAWPPENVALLERFRNWLVAAGLCIDYVDRIHIPMAGHVLGLNLKPYPQLDLDLDLELAMDYIRAKKSSSNWTSHCGHGLNRFRSFLRQELGLVEVHFNVVDGIDLSYYISNLPDWLVQPLIRHQRLRLANWRPARLRENTHRFWCSHARLWRWLLARYPITCIADIKRLHIFAYIDHRLAAGYAPSGINQDLRSFHAFLFFLQEQGQPIPPPLLRIRGLKEPDGLPRFLTDEQVSRLRNDLEERVLHARTTARIRDSLLDRAVFYLLWQGGMRLGEVEELCLENLDLPQRRLTVRKSKGLQDRTVYLTDSTVQAVETFLSVRGSGQTDHVFLYRTRPPNKDLIRQRIKAAGMRVGVKVTPHQLRHTYATQLVNAACPITSIQQLLGHKHINTTLVYARLHDRTVEEDYYAAMAQIEERLVAPGHPANPFVQEQVLTHDLCPDERSFLLELAGQLMNERISHEQRVDLVKQMQWVLLCDPEQDRKPTNGRTPVENLIPEALSW